MTIQIVNSSKIEVIISIISQNNCIQKYRLMPCAEKILSFDMDQININISHNYLSKSKINTTLVADLNLVVKNTVGVVQQIDIYRFEKYTDKCRYILDFLYVETNSDNIFEEYYINNMDVVRSKIMNSVRKEKRVNKHFDRIWPLVLMLGGSTFVLRQAADGLLFIVLLVIDYVLIFLLNKAVDKFFKIDKGIDDEQREKIETINKMCDSLYLLKLIKGYMNQSADGSLSSDKS